MSERDLLNAIRLALSPHGVRLFRNNVALGWVGTLVRRSKDGTVTLAYARPLHAGLTVGSSDLIGWSPVVVQPSHVGTTLAVFTAIEGKTGRLRETGEQVAFREAVVAAGGRAVVARTVADALHITGLEL